MKKVFKNKKVMLSLLTLALCMPLAECGEEQTSSTPESVTPSDTVTSEDLSYLTDSRFSTPSLAIIRFSLSYIIVWSWLESAFGLNSPQLDTI